MKPVTAAEAFTIPTSEYRSLPIPSDSTPTATKLGTCFVKVEDLPTSLQDWMDVNPRIPQRDRTEHMKGRVAKAMIKTLEEEPEFFAYKNLGIWLLVDECEFTKNAGGKGQLSLRMTDKDVHGVVNGGHTFLAIQEAMKARAEDGKTDPWPAYVRLHIIEGTEKSMVAQLAEGLNRSLQVDNPSLENLRGTFDDIREALGKEKGWDQIAYFQGAPGEVEITDILMFMAIFDLGKYRGRKEHPNGLFGQGKAVLDAFVKDAEGPKNYKKVLPKLHEILVLSEQIQQEAVPHAGKIKISDSKKGNRVASPRHKGRAAVFTSGMIDGKIPQGWLLPMLAGFRANVSNEAWDKRGKLEWLVPPPEVLPKVIKEMVEVVYQEHRDNNHKPAEVGRKEAAYRLCYSIVQMELGDRGIHQGT